MKVRVDPSICAGFGVCVGLSADMFELHDDGYAVVQLENVPPELENIARAAVNQCPARAISISDDPG